MMRGVLKEVSKRMYSNVEYVFHAHFVPFKYFISAKRIKQTRLTATGCGLLVRTVHNQIPTTNSAFAVCIFHAQIEHRLPNAAYFIASLRFALLPHANYISYVHQSWNFMRAHYFPF